MPMALKVIANGFLDSDEAKQRIPSAKLAPPPPCATRISPLCFISANEEDLFLRHGLRRAAKPSRRSSGAKVPFRPFWRSR